mgnify:FL=1
MSKQNINKGETHGGAPDLDATQLAKIQEMLKALRMQHLENSNEHQPKNLEDYKFWKTQPVPKFDESIEKEGPIDSLKTVADISRVPVPLKAIPGFEWCDLAVDDHASRDLDDVHELLNENYVEDNTSMFRFNYTKEFLRWALTPPGYYKTWFVGIRVSSSNKLVAFISAVPVTLNANGKTVKAVDINFLCVHKKLRSKRLAPVLIKEITRRVNLENIWQALYTAGVVLPSPVTRCRYTHRPLNWAKLHDIGFTRLPEGATETQMIAKYTLPKNPHLKMEPLVEEQDIDEVFKLLNNYQKKFKLYQDFEKHEFVHMMKTRENVLYSFFVRDQASGKITDFISFYLLPFTILENKIYKDLNVAYLFYYATDEKHNETQDLLKTRLCELVNDACIIAGKQLKVDVFNALTSQDNDLFLKDLKFGAGDGVLNFYLFNYKMKPIDGGMAAYENNLKDKTSELGVVML